MKTITCCAALCCVVLACTAIASTAGPELQPTPDAVSTAPQFDAPEAAQPTTQAVVIHLPAFPKIRSAAACGKQKIKGLLHPKKKCRECPRPAPITAPQPHVAVEPTCCQRLPAVETMSPAGDIARMTPCTLREPAITPVREWRLLNHRTADRPILSRQPASKPEPEIASTFPVGALAVFLPIAAVLGLAASAAVVWRK